MEEEWMFHIKIYYRKGGHKYANLFKTSYYNAGIAMKSITGYRKMNKLERFIFRNCL